MEFLNQLEQNNIQKYNQILNVLVKNQHREHGLMIQELETILSPLELQQFINSIQQNTLEKSLDISSKMKHPKALELLQLFHERQISRDECIRGMKQVLPKELFDEFVKMIVPTDITAEVNTDTDTAVEVNETTPLISEQMMSQKKTNVLIPFILIVFVGIIAIMYCIIKMR